MSRWCLNQKFLGDIDMFESPTASWDNHKKNNNISWRPNQKECDPTIWETFRQYLIHFIDMSYKVESLNFRSRPMFRMAWTFRTQELWALQLVVNGEGEMDLDSGVLLCKDQSGYEITIQIRWFVQKTGQFLSWQCRSLEFVLGAESNIVVYNATRQLPILCNCLAISSDLVRFPLFQPDIDPGPGSALRVVHGIDNFKHGESSTTAVGFGGVN